ncbi:hypothetical protein BK133_11320 [Paenibacillus sp. FSL H8-0548]|uniref:helix-turn-helix domain-containing protein n=1 Tax=Paenibacillus sp. FSL H8-0548 TaxID=1920422 RepID=UPI00096CD480|nr:helix-turn-helix transcriptional regulator [Paenibacillus sp. FSL H8-0548]OMF35285.1 hypothetical protein BK133_11320 [Paenibacillus sp. FSL H8-0548]
MFRLRINELMHARHLNANQLSKLAGVRYPTILDMADNKSKAWSPENLEKIAIALGVEEVGELIEYVKEQEV